MAILWWNATSDELVRIWVVWRSVILFLQVFELIVLKARYLRIRWVKGIGCDGCEFCHNVAVSAHCVADSRDEGTVLPLNIFSWRWNLTI